MGRVRGASKIQYEIQKKPPGPRSHPRRSAQPCLRRRGVHPMLDGPLSVDLDHWDVVLVFFVQLAGPADVDLAELERQLAAHGENRRLRRAAQGASLARVEDDLMTGVSRDASCAVCNACIAPPEAARAVPRPGTFSGPRARCTERGRAT